MLRYYLQQSSELIRKPTRLRRAFIATAAVACAVFFSTLATAADKPAPDKPAREQLKMSAEEAMKPWTGDFDGMIERRTIRVLTVYSKTFYFVDKAVQHGVTYAILRQFEDDLNKKLKKEKKLKKNLKVDVVFIPVARDQLLPSLIAGKGDIAVSNISITEGRQKLVDFSAPLYRKVNEVVVAGPASPAVSNVDDLGGKEVFVRKSSSYYESLVDLNKRLAAEKKPAVILKEAPETLEDEDLIEMVNAGLVPLIVVDDHVAKFWKQIFTQITVHNEIVLRAGADIAWAIRKDSPQLKAVVDDFAGRRGQGTEVGNTILAKYFKGTKFVKSAASDSERQKFIALTDFFKKYGEQYDVDWLLMIAQGYQESQLNQNARSHVGAVGVMQVMPTTGKDLRVGDINQVEPNIHAGIKYMRWMIDTYYGDAPMTKLDKALFAFASYNAGAGRISSLRKEAAKRGLDPNVWFHNVEYVAAQKVGAETVTYVGNIYKYYIAYQLVLESRAARAQAREQLTGEKK